MGIPSFFKWLREKYPLAVRSARGFAEAGGCDHLYLDLNGLIHSACHLAEGNQYGVDEEEMVQRFLAAVEHVVAVAPPRALLYLAIDGVAPRAKLNQQRARRYEAARHRRRVLEADSDSEAEEEPVEATELRLEAIKQSLDLGIFDALPSHWDTGCQSAVAGGLSAGGADYPGDLGGLQNQDIPPDSGDPPPDFLGWDSNCITPGTPFMVRLAERLRSFIRTQQASNSVWRQVAVIFSDSNTCGEGEQKIINFIRAQRCQEGYNPNTTHVICGADADLVMLGLALHDPHCFILRERRQSGIVSEPGCLNFDLISMAALREYIQLEFQHKALRDIPEDGLGVPLERIIDDFIFLCFFVGNDFLPHLPSCFVDAFAIDNLLEIYRKLLPSLGGYLTFEGVLDWKRVGALVAEYAKLEDAQFLREAQAQTAAGGVLEGQPPSVWPEVYYDSMGIQEPRDRQRMCREYARGWLWIATYYACNTHRSDPAAPPRPPHRRETACQWSWYYPFHYAPLAHDVAQFLLNADDKALADIGAYQRSSTQPFKPLSQLLAVLPPDSMAILPRAYREAAQADDSEISDFYPSHYFVDPNGRAQDWKAVVLLPFVDEKRLRETATRLEPLLAPDEARRNELRHSSQLFLPSTHRLAAHILAARGIGFQPLSLGASILQGLVKPTTSSPDGSAGVDPKEAAGVSKGASLQFDFLEPRIPFPLDLHRPLHGTVLPQSIFHSRRDPQTTFPLTGFGQFHVAVVLLVFAVVVGYEAARCSPLTSLADSLSWMAYAAAWAFFFATCGLLVTPQQSLYSWDGPREPRLSRGRKLAFLKDCPPDAYRDWVCRECLAINFHRNEQCHRCGQAKGAASLSLFTHKQAPPDSSKLVIDHRTHLRRVRGWPPGRTARPAAAL